jgi:sec-independent protein translocase protein TatC
MLYENILPSMESPVELRKRLIFIVVTIVIGMGISWNFSSRMLTFIEKPLTGPTYLTELKKDINVEFKKRYPSAYNRFGSESVPSKQNKERKLNYSAPLEPFFVQCKISMIAGLFLSLPLVFLQIWLFAATKLKSGEKHMVVPFVMSSSMAFCIGAAFFLWIIWPVIINFSLSYETEGLNSWFNLDAYVNFCLRLILLFGLIFELPLVALLLSRLGMISGKLLAKNRKYALLASSIVSAFHADLLTMFVIMIPLYLMYEVSVWVAYLFAKVKPANGLFAEVPLAE